MPKKRHRGILEKSILAIAAVFLLVGMTALGFLPTLSRENRALIVIVTSVGVIVCFAGMMSTNALWKWLRKRTWHRAMLAWTDNSQASTTPKFSLACQLSEGGLRHLAIQIYSRMGYIIINKDGEEDYIRLVNPEGRIELVICKQLPNPAEIPNLLSLHREMKKAEAVRGFFCPLGGLQTKPFTGPGKSQLSWRIIMKSGGWSTALMKKARLFWR